MDANEVVQAVGRGVVAALRTSELLLGVEEFASRNADIHPEYITTVKVAEKLTGPDRVVSLEALMKDIRRDAEFLARLKDLKASANWPAIAATLKRPAYCFGKKRLDILVRESSTERPPLLMVEAKLGVKNAAGILADVDRLVTLFEMYQAVGALQGHAVYGAVVFHAMQETGTAATLPTYAGALLSSVQSHLANLSQQNSWLQFNAGLLSATLIQQPVQGYREDHDDGTSENVFEKDQFAFQAGMILIGTTADVATVQF
jgi:hypothetical protein